jgi:hypothetical protein
MDRGPKQNLTILWIIGYIIILTGLYAQEAAKPESIDDVSPLLKNSKIFSRYDSTSVPVEVGFRDHYYGEEVVSSVSGEKPESKLWWNDGQWWGSLWDNNAQEYHIYRLNPATQSWENSGIVIDDRSDSKGDALWDGAKLYIASHIYNPRGTPVSAPNSARLYRYSYDAPNQAYVLDNGFPVVINGSESETLTLDKDSSGKLWITWLENRRVMVNCSQGDDLSWGTPFQLPVQGGNTNEDDISSLVAFGGDKIGLIWTNQNTNKIYFSVHLDGQPAGQWENRELALGNQSGVVDDHINISTDGDPGGNLYAVIKTSLNTGNEPQILLLKRDAGGSWSHHEVGKGRDDHTRPIVLADIDNERIFVLATQKSNGANRIIIKTADMADLIFPPGEGTLFIQSNVYDNINNPTATKQCLTNQTGLAVLASEKTSFYYFHNYNDLSQVGINHAPLAEDDSAATFEDTPIAIAVLDNDWDIDGDSLTIAQLQKGNTLGQVTHTSGDPLVYYSPPLNFFGTDGFQYIISDGNGGRDTASVIVTIDPVNDPPVISGLPQTVIIKPPAAETLDIWAAVDDAETADSALIYQFNSFPDTLSLSYQASTGQLSIAAQNPFSIVAAELIVTVEDPQGAVSSDTILVQLQGAPVSIGEGSPEIPGQFVLLQNFPNPFNPTTQIRFGLPRSENVRIDILNLLGQHITTLVNDYKMAGYHQITFEAGAFAGGMYFYRIQAGNFQTVRKMILLK